MAEANDALAAGVDAVSCRLIFHEGKVRNWGRWAFTAEQAPAKEEPAVELDGAVDFTADSTAAEMILDAEELWLEANRALQTPEEKARGIEPRGEVPFGTTISNEVGDLLSRVPRSKDATRTLADMRYLGHEEPLVLHVFLGYKCPACDVQASYLGKCFALSAPPEQQQRLPKHMREQLVGVSSGKLHIQTPCASGHFDLAARAWT